MRLILSEPGAICNLFWGAGGRLGEGAWGSWRKDHAVPFSKLNSATRPVGFGSSVLSGRARATHLVEAPGRSTPIGQRNLSLLHTSSQTVGGSSTSGEGQGVCHPRAAFPWGERAVGWRFFFVPVTNHRRGSLSSTGAECLLLRWRYEGLQSDTYCQIHGSPCPYSV